MVRRFLSAVLCAGLVAVAWGIWPQVRLHSQTTSPVPQVVPGQIIVKMKPGTTQLTQLAASLGITFVRFLADQSMVVLRVQPDRMSEVVATLRAQAGVEYAEPNY